jgi:hypothetical protein
MLQEPEKVAGIITKAVRNLRADSRNGQFTHYEALWVPMQHVTYGRMEPTHKVME